MRWENRREEQNTPSSFRSDVVLQNSDQSRIIEPTIRHPAIRHKSTRARNVWTKATYLGS